MSTRWIPNGGVNDLEAVVRGGADVVRLPKTDTAQDVLDIEKEILRIEKACGREPGSTGLLAAIESPLGITAQWKSLTLPSV